PRPQPTTVSVWSPYDPRGWPAPKHGRHHADAVAAVPAEVAPVGGCLRVAVAVPHPGAELYVDGVRTAQTGTARVFESPELAAGADCRYELVARWTENGEPVVRKRVVSGKPGEVVRVDFAGPEVVPAGR
ncbi:MAG: TIGR03000 domain-containing protein, partial [Gemmataceae bacterium]|nr:TIGR03000 domain-containing protein [Gemmataceae bacterium]